MEEGRSIDNVQLVKQLREEPLELKHDLGVNFEVGLVGHVLQFSTLHINNHFYLVNTLLIAEFFAVGKFVSPGVLEFFDKEMNQHVNCLDNLHEFL